MKNKKTLYVDMDGVIVDFNSGVNRTPQALRASYAEIYKDIPGIFLKMDPMPGAIDAVKQLSSRYDLFILSTAPWDNSSAWSEKLDWLKKYFGDSSDSVIYKRLILTNYKNLNKGDILIDDRLKNGASEFDGEFINFGSPEFPDWKTVLDHLA